MGRKGFLGILVILALVTIAVWYAALSIPRATPGMVPAPAGDLRTLEGKFAQAAEPGLAASMAVAPASRVFQPELTDRIIIRRAELSLAVKSLNDAMDRIADVAASAGGFVISSSFSSQSSSQSTNPTASIAIRVPAMSYQQTVRQLKELALEVKDERSTAQDVTEEYTDLEAQIRHLEATEARYLDLLGKAKTIDEILKLEQRLDDIRGRIERTKGRLLFLQRSADMALINITLTLPPAQPPVLQPGWNPLIVFSQAFRVLFLAFQGAATVLIWIGVLGSPLLVLGLLWWAWVNRKRWAGATS